MAQMLCALAFLALLALPVSCSLIGRGGERDPEASVDEWMRAPDRFLGANPRKSDASRFLVDLAREGSSGDAAVAWRVDAGLVCAASEVLEAYRDAGDAELMASGYLDLHGNVWGALVMVGSRGVDMVVAISDADDASSSVRVARLGAAI